jgi:hypothetical protein
VIGRDNVAQLSARMAKTLASLHFVAFAILMLKRFVAPIV